MRCGIAQMTLLQIMKTIAENLKESYSDCPNVPYVAKEYKTIIATK